MARLIMTGFEMNDLISSTGPDQVGSAGGAYDTGTVRTGTRSLKIDTTVTSTAQAPTGSFTGSTTTTYFARAYVNFSTINSGSGRSSILWEAATGTGIVLSNGVLQFASTAGGTIGATFTPSLNSWYMVEFSYQSSSGAWEFRVDGNTISTGTQTSASAPSRVDVGASARAGTIPTYVAYFDDVAVNDSTGAAQTSWCGSGKIVLLIPVTDNAKGTGWTNDAAGTTNLFDAVDNLPPVGIADTTVGSGLHQIRNATANANSNYDANLTTYTAAGIGASDTVNVLLPFVATGAPVTTGAKQGTFGIASNPTITNVALSAAGTAGAFWAGTAAGTYDAGWKWTFGTITYAPSVTFGTAPVARITQVTSSTRIAMVCFMGMYVDYTPAAVSTFTASPIRVTEQAVNRSSVY